MPRGHFPLILPPEERVPIRRATLKRIAGIFHPYRRLMGIVAVAIIVTSILGVANPFLVKFTFDRGLGFNTGRGVNIGLLLFFVGLMLALPFVSGTIGLGQTYLSNLIGQRVMRDLRNRLYGHLQRMPLRFFTGTRTGEIQSRLSNDVGGVQIVVTDTAASILSNTALVISTVAAMTLLSWQLTLLSLGVVPFFVWLSHRVGKARQQVAASTQKSLADLSAITEETLSVSGMLLSKSFGRRRYEVDRFERENERLTALQIRQQMIGRIFFASIQIFFSATPALVYLVAGFVISGDPTSSITAGTLAAFTMLQSRLFFPIGQMLQMNVEVQSAMALFERIFEYLDMTEEIKDRPGAKDIPKDEVNGQVRFRGVSFRYEAPRKTETPISPPDRAVGDGDRSPREWTLENVDLEVEPGQLAALVGPSGAGKTTITYLVPRLYDVQHGAVEIDGVDVRDIKLESLGEFMGMVTQETYLFHSSMRDNLLYGNPRATEEDLIAATKAAFIHDKVMELPDGLDTIVGERGYRLSGGEKQRLAIARAILKDPRILILDEATSSLDTTSERLVQEALRPLMRARTTIAIAHRLSTILSADVIFVLDRGRLVERGTHAELVRDGGLYARLYEQQFKSGEVEAECEDGVVLSSGEIVTRGS